MLNSPAEQVAFAHYPKTAGSSLIAWFRDRFPDAAYSDPGSYHTPVRESLEQLNLVAGRSTRPKVLRECLRFARQLAPRVMTRLERCDLRIIGVVREPFEMLVSLYEYWRRYDFEQEPDADLIRSARTGTFRDFLRLAVCERLLCNYDTYFDVGGVAWPTTRLIDFRSLEPGLAAVCREFGIEPPVRLGRHNAAPGDQRDLGPYFAEAGGLMFEVRNHFRWYYDEADAVLVRGDGPRLSRAA